MEIQKTNETKTSMTLHQISPSVIAQVNCIVDGQYEKASALMPKRIEDVFDQPKVRELSAGIGRKAILAQVEYELIQLASLMSVGGNLNRAQVPFIALNLCTENPTESIADFKICFSRGAMGHYGEIQRMDGITINGWMTKYREEKYLLLENKMMLEKENLYKIPELNEQEKERLRLLDVDKLLDEYKASIKEMESRTILPLSEDEIKKEGQEKPLREVYKYVESEAEKRLREHHQSVFNAQELTVRERHPEWSEEQIQTRLTELREYYLQEETKPKLSTEVGRIWLSKKRKTNG